MSSRSEPAHNETVEILLNGTWTRGTYEEFWSDMDAYGGDCYWDDRGEALTETGQVVEWRALEESHGQT